MDINTVNHLTKILTNNREKIVNTYIYVDRCRFGSNRRYPGTVVQAFPKFAMFRSYADQTKYLNIGWQFLVFLNMETYGLGRDIIQKSRGKHCLIKEEWKEKSFQLRLIVWFHEVFRCPASPYLTGLKSLRKFLAQIRAI